MPNNLLTRADSASPCFLRSFLQLLGPGAATHRAFDEERDSTGRRYDYVHEGV